MITATEMETTGVVVVEGYVFEGEEVAHVFYAVRTVRPTTWRTTNPRRAARQASRVARLRAARAK